MESKGPLSTSGQSNKARCSPSQINYLKTLYTSRKKCLVAMKEGKRGWLDGKKLGLTSSDFLFLSLSSSTGYWGRVHSSPTCLMGNGADAQMVRGGRGS